MSLLDPRYRSWLIALPLVGAGLLYLLLVYRPASKRIGMLRQELAQKQEFIDGTEMLRPLVAETRKQLAETRAFTDRWRKRAPGMDDKAVVFEAIQKRVKRAGLETVRFEPLETVKLDVIGQIQVELGTTGSFAQVFLLLQSLEQLPECVWVEDLHLEAPHQAAENIEHQAKLVIFADNSQNSN